MLGTTRVIIFIKVVTRREETITTNIATIILEEETTTIRMVEAAEECTRINTSKVEVVEDTMAVGIREATSLEVDFLVELIPIVTTVLRTMVDFHTRVGAMVDFKEVFYDEHVNYAQFVCA